MRFASKWVLIIQIGVAHNAVEQMIHLHRNG
jgi:hypothetical protein